LHEEPCKKRVPKFVHELPDAKALFETLGAEKNFLPIVIEKDYWVMHCLWGLKRGGFAFEMKGGTSLSKGWRCIDRFSEDIDIRFEPPEGLNLKGEKPAHIEARPSGARPACDTSVRCQSDSETTGAKVLGCP